MCVSGNRHINIRHECVQNNGNIEEKMEGLSRSQKNAKSKASFDFLVLFDELRGGGELEII